MTHQKVVHRKFSLAVKSWFSSGRLLHYSYGFGDNTEYEYWRIGPFFMELRRVPIADELIKDGTKFKTELDNLSFCPPVRSNTE